MLSFERLSGTSPAAIRIASAPTIAVFPTPASPTSSGWFFCRRSRIWRRRRTSTSAAPRLLDKVVREAREHVAGAAGLNGDVTRNALERGHVGAKASGSKPEGLEDDGRRSTNLLRERVEQVLDVNRAAAARLFLGATQELQHRARKVRKPGGRLVHPSEGRLRLDRDVRRIGSSATKDLLHAAVALDRSGQEMHRLDLRVLAFVGQTLRPRDERLRVGRVAVEVNRLLGSHIGRFS
jgi:hypothetical protein